MKIWDHCPLCKQYALLLVLVMRDGERVTMCQQCGGHHREKAAK